MYHDDLYMVKIEIPIALCEREFMILRFCSEQRIPIFGVLDNPEPTSSRLSEETYDSGITENDFWDTTFYYIFSSEISGFML